MGSGSVCHSILSVNSVLLLLPHLFTRFRFSRSLIGSAIITTFCAPLAAFVCFFHFLVRRFPTQFVESIPTSHREIGVFQKQTCADNVIRGIHSAFSLMAIFWKGEDTLAHAVLCLLPRGILLVLTRSSHFLFRMPISVLLVLLSEVYFPKQYAFCASRGVFPYYFCLFYFVCAVSHRGFRAGR